MRATKSYVAGRPWRERTLGLGARSKKEKVAFLKARLKQWAPLLKRFVQSMVEQAALLEVLVDTCGDHELVDAFVHVLNALYEKDLLEQEVILDWADAAEEEDEKSVERRCLATAGEMIAWLREPDDDDDDDEDDEE